MSTTALLREAKGGKSEAIEVLFRQFLPDSEPILFSEYLGLRGLWHIGMHSFICVTPRRVAALEIGGLGRVIYSDATLEDFNSGSVLQPNLIPLYLSSMLLLILTLGVGLILLPLYVKLYHRYIKSGAIVVVREGLDIYIFSDRKRIAKICEAWRLLGELRESRLTSLLIETERPALHHERAQVAPGEVAGS